MLSFWSICQSTPTEKVGNKEPFCCYRQKKNQPAKEIWSNNKILSSGYRNFILDLRHDDKMRSDKLKSAWDVISLHQNYESE